MHVPVDANPNIPQTTEEVGPYIGKQTKKKAKTKTDKDIALKQLRTWKKCTE